MIIVSTDGSCLRNPGGAIGWAWVDHQGTSASGGAASGTNQVAELRAVLEAIVAHPGPEPLLIESDSLYAIKCASEWISGWRVNGWRTSTGNAVKNAELVRHIDHHLAARPGPVRFRWVRGHVGNYFNEQADKLAGAAAREAAASPDAVASGIADLSPLPGAAAPPKSDIAPAKSDTVPPKSDASQPKSDTAQSIPETVSPIPETAPPLPEPGSAAGPDPDESAARPQSPAESGALTLF